MSTVKPTRTGDREAGEGSSAYHHGNLREELVEHALKLAEEGASLR